jgi:VanZ family protein
MRNLTRLGNTSAGTPETPRAEIAQNALQTANQRPRWAWLLWVQLSIILLATLAAYLGLLDVAALGVPGLDKILHFFLVGALAFFSVGWWADRSPWRVLVILSILAIVDETGQSFSAVRSFSLIDLTANLLGILVFGYAAARLVHRRRRAIHLRRAA